MTEQSLNKANGFIEPVGWDAFSVPTRSLKADDPDPDSTLLLSVSHWSSRRSARSRQL